MSLAPQGALDDLRLRYSDRLLSLLTLLLLLLMFVGAPLQAAGITIFRASGVAVGSFALIAGVVVRRSAALLHPR